MLQACRSALHQDVTVEDSSRDLNLIDGDISATLAARVNPRVAVPHGMASFPLTQEPASQPDCAGSSNDGVARAVPAPAGQHQDAPTASDDSGSNSAQESFLELCPAADFNETPERPKEPKDGIPLHVGYGEDGASVQISWDGPTWKTDRAIMQRTVLLGRPVVTAIAFRDLARLSVLSADGKKKTRVGFPVKVWEEIMLPDCGTLEPLSRASCSRRHLARRTLLHKLATSTCWSISAKWDCGGSKPSLAIGRRSAPIGRSLNEAG